MNETEHLTPYLPALGDQLKAIDFDLLKRQQALLLSQEERTTQYTPFLEYSEAGSEKKKKIGQELLKEGAVGCLIVAGGQGSRLGFDGPKGLYPLVGEKTLFQLILEKGCKGRPVAIMTSPTNHKATVDYFLKNDSFGLGDKLSIFLQSELPILQDDGRLFMENATKLATGPNGNGIALQRLVEEGIAEKWRESGVRYITLIPVDNPLADPFDPELIGHHHLTESEVTVKCIKRGDPNEKVGVMVETPRGVEVVEYSELPDQVRNSKLDNGALEYPCANISLFCFSLPFAERVALEELPLHLAHKKVKSIEGEIMGWKFETFIFDVLPLAKKVTALVYPRERCFAPLKEANGAFGPDAVRQALARLTSDV